MAETLTESFCERCGTRYEFSAPTRLNPLRKTRGLFGGLKTYLTSQEALSDSIDDAMRVEQGALASAQLEAFHESFNFCIDCRQYTCVNCWNDDSGRCRTCAPVAGADDVGDPIAATLAGGDALIGADTLIADGALPALGLEAWPTTDLPPEVATSDGSPADAWPTADPLAAIGAPAALAGVEDGVRGPDGFVYDSPRIELEPDVADVRAELEWEPTVAEVEAEPEPMVAEVEPEPEPMVAEVEPEPEPVVAEVEPEPEPVVAEVEPEPVVAEVEPEPEPVVAEVEPEPEPVAAALPPLRVLSWDDDAAYEPEPIVAEVEPEPIVVEPEPEPVVAEVEPEPEPVVAEVEPEPEPVVAEVEAEPEPVVAEVEAEPEPVVAEVEPEPAPRIAAAPINETILRFPQRPATPQQPAERVAAENDSPEVAARRAQLEGLGLGDPGEGPVLPEPPAIVPYRSRGAAVPQGQLAARAAAQGASFWEASAREVASAAATVGIQNCGGCGLSLSASARFCRRCGTPQSQSA